LPNNKKLLALHFIPSILTYVYMALFFYGLPSAEKIFVFRSDGVGFETFSLVVSIAINISGVAYVIWSIWLLQKHKKNILNQFSDIEKIDLNWLRLLTWGLGVLWLVVIFFDGPYIFGGVVVFVFLIGFFGNKQGTIFTSNTPPPIDESPKEKYAKSGLKDDHSDELYHKLTALMKEEALYKNGEISIGDIASKLEVHPNYLSQVINEREEKNFYDFINSYRIEEFKRLLAIPKNQNFTLLALAYDCGFNSKSSFNRYFKKATEQTPSQYFTMVTQGKEVA
jgi:AraC-like DNA-binding protein